MLPGAVLLGLYLVAAVTLPEQPAWLETAGMSLRFLLEAGAYLWAAARPGLPERLRLSLRLFGSTSLFSLLNFLWAMAHRAGWVQTLPILYPAAVGASYVFALVGLLVFPRVSPGRRQVLPVLSDLVLVASALTMLHWSVIREQWSPASPEGLWVVVYAVAQVAVVVGLNVVLNLGHQVPSPRAFWWFVAAQASYVPTAVLGQLHAGYGYDWALMLARLSYLGGVWVTLRAAVLIREERLAPENHQAPHQALPALNPIALFMPVAVGVSLVIVLLRGQVVQARWLGATLVGITLLLALRLALTALENARLLREERLAEQRLVQARAEERSQLLADMHDGFGSQLVSARVRSQRGTLTQPQLTELLGECLADLHLVVDALKAQEGSLSNAFSDYRHRIERRLEGTRYELHWALQPGDEADLSSHVILQLLRVVQEAVNNALKHAQAENIWVAVVRQPDGALQVSVEDDGVGLPGELGAGRGRGFMEARAHSLGARFSLGDRLDGQQGTRVSVWIPAGVLKRVQG